MSESAEQGAAKQLAWLEEMERIEQECFPDARPRSEVVVTNTPTRLGQRGEGAAVNGLTPVGEEEVSR